MAGDAEKLDLEFDDSGSIKAVHHEQVVDGVLSYAAALRQIYGPDSKGIRRKNGNIQGGATARHVAEVPTLIFQYWEKQGIITRVSDGAGGWHTRIDQKKLRRWLNDPTNGLFRVSGGRV